MNSYIITLDDLPYQGRKLVTRYDAPTRRRILERMTEKMHRDGVTDLRLSYLTTSIVEVIAESKSDIPDGADIRIAKLAMEQYRRGECITSEAFIEQLGGL